MDSYMGKRGNLLFCRQPGQWSLLLELYSLRNPVAFAPPAKNARAFPNHHPRRNCGHVFPGFRGRKTTRIPAWNGQDPTDTAAPYPGRGKEQGAITEEQAGKVKTKGRGEEPAKRHQKSCGNRHASKTIQ